MGDAILRALDVYAYAQISFLFGVSAGTIILYTRLYIITIRPLYWRVLLIAIGFNLVSIAALAGFPLRIHQNFTWRTGCLLFGSLLVDIGLMSLLLMQAKRLRDIDKQGTDHGSPR